MACKFRDFTLIFILIILGLVLSFVSKAQMLKNLPNSILVDGNTYFLTQEFQGGTSWSLANKTPLSQLIAAIGGGTGTVTSISLGYGIVGTPNPITSTGNIKLDTATVYSYVRSQLSFSTLQSVTDNGNKTTDSILVKNIEVTGSSFMNGFVSFDSSASAPNPENHKIKMFMGSLGNLGWIGSKGFSSYYNISRLSQSRTYGFPDRNVVIDSLTTSTQTSNGYCKGASGVLSFISSIPNTDLTNSSIFLNGTNVFLGGTFNITDANLSMSDITTNNSSTGQHGFLKKLSGTSTQYMDGSGNWSTPSGTGVTSFSSGNLSPLFTTSVATSTSTPALSFSLSSTTSYSFLANFTGSSSAPTYFQPTGTPSSTTFFRGDGTWSTPVMPSQTQYYTFTGSGSSSPNMVAPSSTLGYSFQSLGSSAYPSFQDAYQRYNPSYSSTLTINSADVRDIVFSVILTGNLTLANPTGTFVDGQSLIIKFYGASAYTLSFGGNFDAGTTVALPSALTAGKELDMLFVYSTLNSLNKWNFEGFTDGH